MKKGVGSGVGSQQNVTGPPTLLEIQSVMLVMLVVLVIFDPSCELAARYRLSSSPPPSLPCVNKYLQVYTVYTVCNSGGIGFCGEHRKELYTCVSGQIPNLKNCFTTPNNNLGGEGASDRSTLADQVPLLVNF
jgi:hypothetical protein